MGDVRTRLGDNLLALRRPAALAAVAAAAGGLVAAMVPRMGLWRLTAQVQALDTVGEQPVAVLTGADTSPWTWAVAGIGLVVVVLALLVAVDRPPPLAEPLLVGSGALLLLAAGALVLGRPAPAAFSHLAGVAELVDGKAPLPSGVGIELVVEPAVGLWVLAAAGLLVVSGTMVALRRG